MRKRSQNPSTEKTSKTVILPGGALKRPRCPVCGYTEFDCHLHNDHNRCSNYPYFPWEQPVEPPPGWTPTKADIEWTRVLVNSLKEGGYWHVPGSSSLFRFWPSEKKFTLQSGNPKHPLNIGIRFCLQALNFAEV